MDKQWQDIHIIYGEEYPLTKPVNTCTIRQVNIKSVTTNDSSIKINIIDAKGNESTIIVPKLYGVKVVFD